MCGSGSRVGADSISTLWFWWWWSIKFVNKYSEKYVKFVNFSRSHNSVFHLSRLDFFYFECLTVWDKIRTKHISSRSKTTELLRSQVHFLGFLVWIIAGPFVSMTIPQGQTTKRHGMTDFTPREVSLKLFYIWLFQNSRKVLLLVPPENDQLLLKLFIR